jgi:hypothetical protein
MMPDQKNKYKMLSLILGHYFLLVLMLLELNNIWFAAIQISSSALPKIQILYFISLDQF